jgi:hypothetical protein
MLVINYHSIKTVLLSRLFIYVYLTIMKGVKPVTYLLHGAESFLRS